MKQEILENNITYVDENDKKIILHITDFLKKVNKTNIAFDFMLSPLLSSQELQENTKVFLNRLDNNHYLYYVFLNSLKKLNIDINDEQFNLKENNYKTMIEKDNNNNNNEKLIINEDKLKANFILKIKDLTFEEIKNKITKYSKENDKKLNKFLKSFNYGHNVLSASLLNEDDRVFKYFLDLLKEKKINLDNFCFFDNNKKFTIKKYSFIKVCRNQSLFDVALILNKINQAKLLEENGLNKTKLHPLEPGGVLYYLLNNSTNVISNYNIYNLTDKKRLKEIKFVVEYLLDNYGIENLLFLNDDILRKDYLKLLEDEDINLLFLFEIKEFLNNKKIIHFLNDFDNIYNNEYIKSLNYKEITNLLINNINDNKNSDLAEQFLNILTKFNINNLNNKPYNAYGMPNPKYALKEEEEKLKIYIEKNKIKKLLNEKKDILNKTKISKI